MLQKTSDFVKLIVCPHEQRVKGGVNFSRFCANFFYGRPLVSLDFLPLNLLLVQSHLAEVIIVTRLIQERNNVYDMLFRQEDSIKKAELPQKQID